MAADYLKILNSLKDGTEEPKVKTSTESKPIGGIARPFNWKDYEAVTNFFGEAVTSGFPDYSSWSWDEVSLVVDKMSAKMSAGLKTTSGGLLIAEKSKIVNSVTNTLTGTDWAGLWEVQTTEDKARIIWEYLIAFSEENYTRSDTTKLLLLKDREGGELDIRRLLPVKGKHPYYLSINSGTKAVGTFANLGQEGITEFYVNTYNTVQNATLLEENFASRINLVFFDKKFEKTDMSNEDRIKEAVVGPRASGDVDFEAELEKLRNAKLKQAELLKDLSKKAEEDDNDKPDRDAFFKKIEQCLLLCGAEKLGAYRKRIRAAELADTEDIEGSKRSKRFPYGGKIICVDAEENLFMNYCDSDGETFNFTTKYLHSFIDKINYNFVISKVNRVKIDDNEYDLEMPLLFEGQSNSLNTIDGENVASSYKGTRVFIKGDTTVPSDLTTEDLIKMPSWFANDSITYEDVSIKFHGENQATAKTNVDVELTIGVTNLLSFQTIFSNKAHYIDSAGKSKSQPYDYSLLDLITYLHRSDLGDVYKNLSTGGARLYNPTYFRNFNRLIMKAIPIVSAGPTTGKEGEYFKIFKEHVESTPLILDLALIDHTITKESENNNAKIKISYKGYVKSFLQDAKLDIIRTSAEIVSQIDKETELIESLSPLSDVDAIKRIDAFNKLRKEETLDLTKDLPYMNELVDRDFLFKLKVKGNTFKDSITKDYKLIGSRRIYNAITDSSILTMTETETEVTDPIKDTIEDKDYEINFFYLGDLIDVAMRNIYSYKGPLFITEGAGYSENWDVLNLNFTDFPLKVILPSFKALKPDPDGSSWIAGEKISVADFPIAETWFQQWWRKEVVEAEVQYYTLGTFISRLINNLFNSLILEDCYLNGSHERRQFGVRTDFGLFSKEGAEQNAKFKKTNKAWLDEELNYNNPSAGVSSFLEIGKGDAPYFKKNPSIPRTEHCNFIVVYPQIAMFSDYKGLYEKGNNETTWEEYNIPVFHRQRNTEITGKPSSFTDSISFTKEEANYRREARFQAESLYTLSQLASVYNATCKSKFALDLFPGMLVYIDAGLYQGPEVMNSIANILGMGGYHIIESVTHTAKINKNLLGEMITTTEAVWVGNGSIKLEGEVPEKKKTKSVVVTPAGPVDGTEETTATPAAEPVEVNFDEAGSVLVEINQTWGQNKIKLKNKKYTYKLIDKTDYKKVELFFYDETKPDKKGGAYPTQAAKKTLNGGGKAMCLAIEVPINEFKEAQKFRVMMEITK